MRELVEKPSTYSNPDTIREVLGKELRRRMVNSYDRMLIISKTLDFLKVYDTVLEEIQGEYANDLIFIYKKQHKYFDTIYKFMFDSEVASLDRVFFDCICNSNHERLLKNPSFKSLISKTERKTGYTFKGCNGGYEDFNYDFVTGELMLTNRLNLTVSFRIDNEKTAVYDLDLDRMELSNEIILY